MDVPVLLLVLLGVRVLVRVCVLVTERLAVLLGVRVFVRV